jgi:hypothetical protein
VPPYSKTPKPRPRRRHDEHHRDSSRPRDRRGTDCRNRRRRLSRDLHRARHGKPTDLRERDPRHHDQGTARTVLGRVSHHTAQGMHPPMTFEPLTQAGKDYLQYIEQWSEDEGGRDYNGSFHKDQVKQIRAIEIEASKKEQERIKEIMVRPEFDRHRDVVLAIWKRM